jgi:hypothetical protein
MDKKLINQLDSTEDNKLTRYQQKVEHNTNDNN